MKNGSRMVPANASPNQSPRPAAGPDRPPTTPTMLTIQDVSQRFQISIRQIYRCIDRGELPRASHRLGRKAAWPVGVIEQLEACWAAADLADMKRRQQTINRPL